MLHLSTWIFVKFTVVISVYYWVINRADWKLMWYAVAGFALSFLFHPHYYALKRGVLELGAEFFPLSTRDPVIRYPGLFMIIPAVVVKLISGSTLNKSGFSVWIIGGTVYGMLGLVSRRNLTHFYPIAVVIILYLFQNAAHRFIG